MSKCPYHKGASSAPSETPQEIPAGHPPVPAGSEGEMCSHARKKLEAQRQAEAARAGVMYPEGEAKTWTNEQLKEHFTSAYNHVAASTAPTRGDAEIAAILVGSLGYSAEEIKVIGSDVRLMQGTGNPHRLAKIQPGEFVVDLGSGFGLDAILAGSRVGAQGRVVGIDLSINELTSAIQRVSNRKLRNVDFRLGDIEDPPLEDSSVDCVISNGGFCLVPNKKLAFQQIFRMLKPGGRFSISCTVRKKALDMSKNWPSCMVVFMPLEGAVEMLQGLGFAEVHIDDKNSEMDTWDEKKEGAEKPAPQPEVDKETAAQAKITIHRGDPQYDFLKSMDMNEWFARVNIFGRKPQ